MNRGGIHSALEDEEAKNERSIDMAAFFSFFFFSLPSFSSLLYKHVWLALGNRQYEKEIEKKNRKEH